MLPLTPAKGPETEAFALPWANLTTGRPRRTEKRSSSLPAWSRFLGNIPVAECPCYPTSIRANWSRSSAELPGEPHRPPHQPNRLHHLDLLPLREDHLCRPHLVGRLFRLLRLAPSLDLRVVAVLGRNILEHHLEAPYLPMATHRRPVLRQASILHEICGLRMLR